MKKKTAHHNNKIQTAFAGVKGCALLRRPIRWQRTEPSSSPLRAKLH